MKMNNGMVKIETMSVDDIVKLIKEYKDTKTNTSASCSPDYSKVNKALEEAIISQLNLFKLGVE